MVEESKLTDEELNEKYNEQRRKFYIAVADCECVFGATAGRQTNERLRWPIDTYHP